MQPNPKHHSAQVQWPYPRWVAHRGGGTLAPENTLAAFRVGAAHGYRMFECDVKLSSDGKPFLLHDSSLERTTNAPQRLPADSSMAAGDHPWQVLGALDAGSWHSRQFAGEPVPTLEAVARYCIANHFCLNIEIKPSPGFEQRTGELVARHAANLWRGAAIAPLLTSFDVAALQAAQLAEPQLPRGLLLEEWPGDWLETATALGCCALVCHHPLWDQHSVQLAKNAGLRSLSYTVNEATDVQRLLALGTDGIITDRIDRFSPAP
jgi:glycerophosphoryl diester phosphodiesterase